MLGLVEAEGMRWRTRSFVLVDSTSAFYRLWSMAASMPAMFPHVVGCRGGGTIAR